MDALMLTDLVQEVSLDDVVAKYSGSMPNQKINRGILQGLQERSTRYANMVASFCERMGWGDLEALVARLQVPLLHTTCAELR